MLQAHPFLLALLTAMLVENPVFSRALGLNKPTFSMGKVGDCLRFGLVFTWMLFFSSMGAWVVNQLLMEQFFARYVRAMGFLLVTAVVYVITHLLAEKFLPQRFDALHRALPLTAFNPALFGTLYVTINNDFLPTLGYALGTGFGYTLAVMMILYIRKSLAARPVPRSFRGLPATLVYIGLLSLGFYGLIGHGLPV